MAPSRVLPMSYYADPSVWVQGSRPGLAGATGEQMRTVGARFNLAKRYRMRLRSRTREGRVELFTLRLRLVVSVGGKSKKKKMKKKKGAARSQRRYFFYAWRVQTETAHAGLCHHVSAFTPPPLPPILDTHPSTQHTLKDDDCRWCNSVCVCVLGV